MRRVGLFQISVYPLMSGSMEASWLFLAARPVVVSLGRSFWKVWGTLGWNKRVAHLRNHTVRRAVRRPPMS